MEGTAFVSGSESNGALAFLFPDANGSDVVLVSCSGQARDRLSASASALAAGLWSPWESPAAVSEPSLVVTPQAGGPNTVVTLRGTGFEGEWGTLTLVSAADGTAPIEIPTSRMGDHRDTFTWVFAVDRSQLPGIDPVEIPPGTYEVVVDGRLIEGATFTKTIPPFPWVEIVEVLGTDDPVAPIGTVLIENRDIVSAELDGWRLVDEITPTAGLVIDNVTLEPGERLVVRFVQGTCTLGVVVAVEPHTLSFCAAGATVTYESIALRDGEGRLVDRVMVAPRDDPWVQFYDAEYGVRFELPVDHDLPVEIEPWQIADESLTPILSRDSDHSEILSLGTYPMRVGGDGCAQFPESALEDLGTNDALVSIQLWSVDPPFPAAETRPEDFTFEWLDEHGKDNEIPDCLTRADAHNLYIRGVPFIDRGALYYVLVAVGDAAFSTTRAEQLLEILNRLEVDER